VKDSHSDPASGRTNWRRFAVAAGIPALVAGGLVLGVANGALAASFSISGSQFKLSADKLVGTGFTQYSKTLPSVVNQSQTGKPAAVAAMSGIQDATLYNLCQTVAVGPVVLRIEAGKDTPVHGTNMLIGMSELSGDAEFEKINIGQDASTVSGDGLGEHGDAGGFGQQADKVTITNLHQIAYSTQAQTFSLPGMSLKLFFGNGKECF
jgi:hypothetical protein